MKMPITRRSTATVLSPPPSPPLSVTSDSSSMKSFEEDRGKTPAVQCDATDRVKRPMNPFMVWAQQERPRLSALHPGIHNAELSRLLGLNWNKMSEGQKQPFKDEANRIAERHRQLYPDYKYRPKKKDPLARRVRGRRIKQEEISRVFKLLSQQEISQYVGLSEKKRKPKACKTSARGEGSAAASKRKLAHSSVSPVAPNHVLTCPTSFTASDYPADSDNMTAADNFNCHPCPSAGISSSSAFNTPPMTPCVKQEPVSHHYSASTSPYPLTDSKIGLFSMEDADNGFTSASPLDLLSLAGSEPSTVFEATPFEPLQFERMSHNVSPISNESSADDMSLLSPLDGVDETWLQELCKTCDVSPMTSPCWKPASSSDQFFASLDQLDPLAMALSDTDVCWPGAGRDSGFLFQF